MYGFSYETEKGRGKTALKKWGTTVFTVKVDGFDVGKR